VDMGAYESPPEYEPIDEWEPLSIMRVKSNALPGGNGSSWDRAVRSISAAIQVMGATGEIWVAAGTYHESIHMEPGIALYGGFVGTEETRGERYWTVNETIIDAAGLDTPAVTGADDAILDGFTITGGEDSGVCCYVSSPTLTNCTISENTAGFGGGVYCEDSSPTLSNCTISGNTPFIGGGVYCRGSCVMLVNCMITGNTAYEGGGVCCEYSSSALSSCVIAGNTADRQGGGIHCSSDSSVTLVNCSFSGNSATNGNTLACDSYNRPSTVNIANSILWDGEDEIWNNDDSTITISYSDICGGWPGEGNIDSDPHFVQPWDGKSADLHLSPGSPCIDAGNPDPSHNDRCLPPGLGTQRCDMGAYGGPGNCGWLESEGTVGVLEWMMY
ncbi:MAG: right-handed parallel beta-helix repeat-containing protein, partial [bacterium]